MKYGKMAIVLDLDLLFLRLQRGKLWTCWAASLCSPKEEVTHLLLRPAYPLGQTLLCWWTVSLHQHCGSSTVFSHFCTPRNPISKEIFSCLIFTFFSFTIIKTIHILKIWLLGIHKGSQPGHLCPIKLFGRNFFSSFSWVRREYLNKCISLCNQLPNQDVEHICHPQLLFLSKSLFFLNCEG